MTAFDMISIAFGAAVGIGIVWACWQSGLLVRGVDRQEDGRQSEADVQRIVECTQPAPLQMVDMPKVRAGTCYGKEVGQ